MRENNQQPGHPDTRLERRSAVSRSCAHFLTLFLILSLCSLCLGGETIPQLDPGLDRPYRLRVVLHFAENRFLTTIFQEQVERDLRDLLQQTYGQLVEVEVVRQHARLREVLNKGLQQALDAWEDLADERTHFVLIDYVDGRYELQARQHDGATGLSSPVVRKERTTDRQQVARMAAQLVDRDFGLVGTVVEGAKDEARLAIQGGRRGEDLGRWLKKGDILAVVRLQAEGGRVRAAPMPWAVLQALEAPREGQCRCRYFSRFKQDRLASAPGVVGYRCLQLATVTAPVRLRLIDDQNFQPLDGLQIHVSRRQGFNGKGQTSELTSNADGLAVTQDAFANLAFVRVLSSSGPLAKFAVPLVDERTVVCRLRANLQAGPLEALEFRKDLWVRRIYDDLLAGSERVAEMNALLGKSLDAALARARHGAKNLHEEVDSLELERDQLVRQAAELKVPATKFDLSEGEQRLEELRQRRQRLQQFIGRLESAIKEGEKTRGLLQLLERARLLENQTEIDQAIALYKKVLDADSGQAKVRQHLEALEKSWALRSADHTKAREFILKSWPRTDVPGLKVGLDEVKKAFETCRQNDDRLTPRKLLVVNLSHAANLKKRLDTLKRQDTEDNRAEARALVGVAQGLMQFHREVASYLGPPKKSPE